MRYFIKFYKLKEKCKFLKAFVFLFLLFNIVFQILLKFRSQNEGVEEFESFCSSISDLVGPKQDVIALSLFGNFSDPEISTRYLSPIPTLLKNMSQVYPGNKNKRKLLDS